ncbi:pentatricopeptide repeat-containing protein At4g33170 [Manihot esculenta]|nr:pentatricopeptide repeat-containing protein At4g33170 [Manihot esculenta]
MSLSKKGSQTNNIKLNIPNKATALNPNAAEFVPFFLRSSSSPSGSMLNTIANTAIFPASGTMGKAVLDRSESSISNASDDETHQLWHHQLPDDITPDFNIMGKDDPQAPGGISLAGLSLHDTSEETKFPVSLGSGYALPEQQEQSPRHINGSFSEKMRFDASSHGAHPTATSYFNLPSKPWDKQIIKSDQLLVLGDGREVHPYNGISRPRFMNDVLGERQLAIVDDTDMNPVEFLASQFPGFAAESLAEAYFANGCDLNLTTEMLTQLELQVDGGFNQNMKSKTFSASNPSALDFPAPPIQNGPSKYAGDGLQQSGNPYGSSDKDNIPLFKSSSSITSGGGAVDFASAVRKLASQDFGIWKYDRNDSADSAVGPSRTSHVLARSYSSGNGRGIYTDRVRNHGSSNAVPAWLETGAAVANMYSELREEARDHAQLRNACLEQARHAYLIGNKALAKELSVKGQLHNIHMKAAHGKAQETVYRLRNPVGPETQTEGWGHERIIDLHGLHDSEAIYVLKHEVSVLRSTARAAEQPLQVYIHVGTGHHTRGSRTSARLPITVQQYLLEEEGLDYTEPQPGLLRVVIYFCSFFAQEMLLLLGSILIPLSIFCTSAKSPTSSCLFICFRSRFSALLDPNSLPPSPSQCFSLLRTAVSTSNLPLGKCIHAGIITSGQTSDRFLVNNLITMYSKCGSLTSARRLFDRTLDRDLVTWNSILAAYAQSADSHFDHVTEGFRLFRLLRWCYIYTSKMTLAPLLKLSLLSGYICASEAVHGYAVKIGLEWDVFVSGALVNIYSKFGLVREAIAIFERMQERDVVLWNVMLKAYVESSMEEEALALFSEFHRSGLRPDDATVFCVINGISDICSHTGKKYMEQIQAYATKLLFYDDNNPNVVMWNKKLSEYLQAGEYWDAVSCFIHMIRSYVTYDNVTLVVVLAAAAGTDNLRLGQQIHGMVLRSGFDSVVSVANSVINMYSKLGFVSFAKKVFTGMNELDLISWNSMISCFAQNNLEQESVNLLIGLLRDGLLPNHFTLASLLRACSSIAEGLYLCKQIHVYAIKTCTIADTFVSTALIDVYSRSGLMAEAEFLFKNKNEFDLVTWNTMMSGYITSNDIHKALELFALMHKRGESSDEITLATAAKACGCLERLEQGKQVHAHAIKLGLDSELFVSSSILDTYIKCGDMENAHLLFNDIPKPDDVAWTTMISGCVENGDEKRVFSIYHQMRLSGVLPDEYTFASLIKASSCLTALEQGRQIHANVIKLNCASDTFVGTSLIDMYAKCGNIEDAYCFFKRMNVRDNVLWNAMLVGLAQHGHGREALHLFQVMKSQGIQPDRVTFIGVLSACSLCGFVSEAYGHFCSMRKDYGIHPEIEHYAYLVDALGRAGHVQEAEKLILSMPFEASASMYRALLGACHVQGDMEAGKRLATKLMALEPSDSATYVLLSNIYAAAKQWDGASNARRIMQRKNVKKDPGFSWIDVKNRVHLCVVDDGYHSDS